MRIRTVVSIEENPAAPESNLLWYSRAVGIMRTRRAFADPTSWRFQSGIHDYDKSTDPYLSPTDPPPSGGVQAKYFRQCQHSSWFFLPWHRMYLYIFERIVADAVVEAGGPANWALPYWDYTASAAARKLPWAFRQPTWPGGETNYLYVPERASGINTGTTSLAPADVEAQKALDMTMFSTSTTSSDVQFGGPRAKNHDGGAYPFGGVESSPHNHVHVAVGGPNGFMIDPTQAALDPIFWLHHSNIDRLWEVWIREPAHANPNEPAWQTGVAFPFFDEKRKPVEMTSSQVLQTTQLGYRYDTMPALLAFNFPKFVSTPRLPRPALIGATEASFTLGAAKRQITIPTDLPNVSAFASNRVAPQRVMLHLENLTAKERAGSYDVYVSGPAETDVTSHPSRRAGRISLFGAKASNRRTRSHARDGFSFVLNITDIYQQLSASGDWDPAKLKVTFQPVYEWNEAVEVGRVSVNLG